MLLLLQLTSFFAVAAAAFAAAAAVAAAAAGGSAAAMSLGNLCPSLRYTTVEGGAGFYENSLALFGYIIHMAAVVALFDRESAYTPQTHTNPKP